MTDDTEGKKGMGRKIVGVPIFLLGVLTLASTLILIIALGDAAMFHAIWNDRQYVFTGGHWHYAFRQGLTNYLETAVGLFANGLVLAVGGAGIAGYLDN